MKKTKTKQNKNSSYNFVQYWHEFIGNISTIRENNFSFEKWSIVASWSKEFHQWCFETRTAKSSKLICWSLLSCPNNNLYLLRSCFVFHSLWLTVLVEYNSNHSLKLWCVLNRIIKTSWKVHFFQGHWPGLLWRGLTKPLWPKIWSDLLFCGSIFIVVTSNEFLHMCYMGYLKLLNYKFVGGLTTSKCLKIWSD